MVGGLIGCLIGRLVGCLKGGLVGRMFEWWVGWKSI